MTLASASTIWLRLTVAAPASELVDAARPRNTSVSATRVTNVAIGLVEQQEERLRAIIESKQATPDEKFEALVDLAHLAGVVLLGAAEAEETLDKR